jgi:aspartyl-tRNA(Asn)/glutamyl-tRNA(Gln) amidotransferase subunit A
MALLTLGTDTGGSVRIPGALNGVCALRPTFGRVSHRGVIHVSWSFDTVGPLGRYAEDVAYLLGVLAGYDADDPASIDAPVPRFVPRLHRDMGGIRVGLLGGYFQREPVPEVRELVRQAAQVFEDLGAAVDELNLPGVEAVVERTSDMILADVAAYHRDRLAERPEDFGPDVLTRLRIGAGTTGMHYALARQEQRRWRRQVEQVFRRYDLLLAPTCGLAAPLIEESDGVETTRLLTRFTFPFTFAGVPALNVPCGFTAHNLPIGLQLVGRHWEEASILQAAWAYQQRTDWHVRCPALPDLGGHAPEPSSGRSTAGSRDERRQKGKAYGS